MTALTQKQVAILRGLESHRGSWMSREDLVPFAGFKGYSMALGAPTRVLRPDCLEARGLVRRLDDTKPFQYQITPSGRQVLTGILSEGVRGFAPTKHLANAAPDAQNSLPVRTTAFDSQICSSSSSVPHDLAKFSVEIRRMIGAGEGIRPLVCSGDPFNCQVALIGANPGSMTPFWPHWSDVRGMNKETWLDEYRQQHGGKYGRSRAAIERFVPLVNARVLELNAHGKQSRRLAHLASEHRTTELLEFVLRAVRPQVALCAGSDAVRAVTAINSDWGMKIIVAPHYIYWGGERERQMAQEINACLSAS